MRYFPLVDWQYWIMAIAIGIVCLVLVYMAWGSYPARRIPRDDEEIREMRGHEIQSGHSTEHNPIAPFLVFVYVLIGIWSLCYMVFVGVRGGQVGY
jgi:hypothetical protein